MGKPLSWTGLLMRDHIVKLAGGLNSLQSRLERIDNTIEDVLINAGSYVGKELELISILGAIQREKRLADRDKKMADDHINHAFTIIGLSRGSVKRIDKIEFLKNEIAFLTDELEKLESEEEE